MEVTMVAAQCRESWPQISEPGGRVLDRTRERAWGRWGGGGMQAGTESRRRRETDGSKCGGVGGWQQAIDRGGIVFQELTARNMFPSCRYGERKRREEEREREASKTEIYIAGMSGSLGKG